MVFSYDYARPKIWRQRTKAPPSQAFLIVERCDSAIPRTLHYEGGKRLSYKPLKANIGRLLAPYRPGGRQGDSKQNNDAKCVHFADHFDGHHDAGVQYRAH
jgi:hypothetical protein